MELLVTKNPEYPIFLDVMIPEVLTEMPNLLNKPLFI